MTHTTSTTSPPYFALTPQEDGNAVASRQQMRLALLRSPRHTATRRLAGGREAKLRQLAICLFASLNMCCIRLWTASASLRCARHDYQLLSDKASMRGG